MAKPTWMSTHSPVDGGSSCNKPRSTLRRTPRMSTTAKARSSASRSTIFPGMARHMFLFLLSRDDIELELQLIFHFQRPAGNGDQRYSVITLQQGEFSGGAQHGAHQGKLRGHGNGTS